MTGAVTKIFILLIAVVICVVVGAFLINIIMPNALQTMSNAVEGGVYSATGVNIDINGDGTNGQSNRNVYTDGTVNGDISNGQNSNNAAQKHEVDGFSKQTK